MEETLNLLRRRLSALEPASIGRREGEVFGLGLTALDDALGGGLARAGLHEILPGQHYRPADRTVNGDWPGSAAIPT